MNIVVCGASGMIGRALVRHLVMRGETVTVVGRALSMLQRCFPDLPDQKCWSDLTAEWLATQDVVVNLAGENISAARWRDAQRQRLMESRVRTSAMLATLCAACGDAAPRLINASAIGIYGVYPTIAEQNAVTFSEHTAAAPSQDFLSEIGRAWEAAVAPAEQAGVSVLRLRFAVVLSRSGGALAALLPSFKMGLGARLGSGEQPFSWVALEDVVGAISWCIDHPALTGPLNVVADEVVSQKQFARQLAAALHRPQLLRLPGFVVKQLFGQMGEELLLNGQRVASTALKASGFAYRYPCLAAYFSAWQQGQK